MNIILCLILVSLSFAQAAEEKTDSLDERESPWLILPLLSTNPKLDTAVGAMAAYIKKFDELSRASMFGVQTKYSKSDSIVGGIFGRTSFGEDHHRIVAGMVFGKVNNDYQNFLESGQTLDSQDLLRAAFTRYLYRIKGHFFIGLQGAFTNYEVAGRSSVDEDIIDQVGLVGFKSGGVGLSLLYDSRDNDFKPSKGLFLNANNIAYREALAGEEDFDIYRLDSRYFIPHGHKNVLGFRQRNQWASEDTPTGAYSPVQIRGYTPGELLAQFMSSIEVEERLCIGEKWTSTIFTGVAVLYGDGSEVLSNQYFPTFGLGIQYIVKPKEGLVLNLEAAKGRSEDQAVYLKMGYSF